LTNLTNRLYYKGNQKGEKMFTILLSLLACGEEKADDSAQPVEEQQEQQDVPVEDTGEETIEDTASAE
tara:strand:- start:42 stop:245 length:204 start_codon:yes stop_codon:yes gene_type:complete